MKAWVLTVVNLCLTANLQGKGTTSTHVCTCIDGYMKLILEAVVWSGWTKKEHLIGSKKIKGKQQHPLTDAYFRVK